MIILIRKMLSVHHHSARSKDPSTIYSQVLVAGQGNYAPLFGCRSVFVRILHYYYWTGSVVRTMHNVQDWSLDILP